MSYDLYIAHRTYSSWSLRGWLTFEKFGLHVRTHKVGLYSGTMSADLAPVAPARTVPVMRMPDGVVVGDTLAIVETLAERHPDAGLWPADPAARGFARWLAAEMHSSFTALRGACPMDLGRAYAGFEPDEAVRADLARIERLWAEARARFGEGWLCGDYSLADVFYAPVATRIATFGLEVSPEAAAYVARHLADPAFRKWRAMGAAEAPVTNPYAKDLPLRPWPGPEPIPAEVAEGPSENAACPYSGKPVTHFLSVRGRTFGFCNAFCRDKTLADPEAWPAFMALLNTPAD